MRADLPLVKSQSSLSAAFRISQLNCPTCEAGPLTVATRTSDLDVLACLSCGTTMSVLRPRGIEKFNQD
jgi:transcription elongation factor Elf1